MQNAERVQGQRLERNDRFTLLCPARLHRRRFLTGLAHLQQEFHRWLVSDGKAAEPVLADCNPAGLQVYHHAYHARLREALSETFDKTWAWLGDDEFDEAVAAYISAHPPSAHSLDMCGRQFSGFLATRYPGDLEVGELAAIEWALHLCFIGEDAEPVNAAAFAAADWETARLHLVPTFLERTLLYNSAALWRALDDGMDPPVASVQSDVTVYRFWRKGFSPHFTAMDVLEARALNLVQKGLMFSEVCEKLADDDHAEDLPHRLGLLLGQWQVDGLIAAIS
jgi:hypothetical protein